MSLAASGPVNRINSAWNKVTVQFGSLLWTTRCTKAACIHCSSLIINRPFWHNWSCFFREEQIYLLFLYYHEGSRSQEGKKEGCSVQWEKQTVCGSVNEVWQTHGGWCVPYTSCSLKPGQPSLWMIFLVVINRFLHTVQIKCGRRDSGLKGRQEGGFPSMLEFHVS